MEVTFADKDSGALPALDAWSSPSEYCFYKVIASGVSQVGLPQSQVRLVIENGSAGQWSEAAFLALRPNAVRVKDGSNILA